MAALAILAGIGAFCYLLYGAAVYALPFLVGVFVGLHAEQAGTGPLSGPPAKERLLLIVSAAGEPPDGARSSQRARMVG